MLSRETKFGAALLLQHGWKWDASTLRFNAPNGKYLGMVSLFHLTNMKFAMRTLERGGTPPKWA